MPVTYTYPYLQYGGIWSLNSQTGAQAANTWPTPPLPQLFSWGQGNVGELGLGNVTNYSSPKQVGTISDWSELSTGYESSMGVKTNNSLWGWGNNAYSQTIPGVGGAYYSSPKQVGALTNWKDVAGGFYTTATIKTDGTLWTWGYNGSGTLGLNTSAGYVLSPTQVGALINWAKVRCGNTSMAAIKTDGTLWTWGYNGVGGLGLNNTTTYSSPMQVGSDTNWSMAVMTGNATIALKTNGTLWGWGNNAQGQLGLNNTTNYSSPKQVGALTTWVWIAAVLNQAFAIRSDGTLWAWGYNPYGQLGTGNTTYYSSPKQIGALTNWLTVSANTAATYALKTDGTLWSWGRNQYGQLGQGNTTYFSSPKQVGSLTSWTQLAKGGGNNYVLAIAKI